MQIIIFLIEVILIFFFLDFDKLSSINIEKNISSSSYNSNYEDIDSIGNTVLNLKNISKSQKIIVWQNSSLKNEMMRDFPNISIMSKFVNSRIIDNKEFKQKLIYYMENIQGKYLSGDITQAEFRKALENPDPNLPAY
ncbi:MAG: hypothetical protein KAU90_09480 [Sulfurovaceae bacterium]|nr:hypothetical protein [Sulfurovaceae bacterium]